MNSWKKGYLTRASGKLQYINNFINAWLIWFSLFNKVRIFS